MPSRLPAAPQLHETPPGTLQLIGVGVLEAIGFLETGRTKEARDLLGSVSTAIGEALARQEMERRDA